MKQFIPLITCLLLLLATASLPAQKKKSSFEARFSPQLKQTADSQARLDKWYRDAKYGAFIHFGVYSMPGGKYEDKIAKGDYSELLSHRANKDGPIRGDTILILD